jgi:hypothetical protein
LAGIRSGDVLECLVDFNRNHVSEEDIKANKNLSEEQKMNEISKLKYQNDFQQRFIIKF